MTGFPLHRLVCVVVWCRSAGERRARRGRLSGIIALSSLLLAACGDDPNGQPDLGDAADVVDAADADDIPVDGAPDDPVDVPTDGVDAMDLPDADTADAADAPEEAGFDAGNFDHGVAVEFEPEAVPLDEDLFPIGVQAGAMRPDSVLLWSYASDRATKTLRVWRDSERDGEVILVFDERVEPSEAGYFHVPVDELAPGTIYRYAFFATAPGEILEGRSDIGRVRTAFAPGTLEPITIGAGSCTHQRYAPWDSLVLAASEDLDLFLHLGDMSYNDDAHTVEEYRALWQETLSDRGYRALYRSTGLYATWDDHEVEDNYDPETIDPNQLQAAIDTFYETVAVERGPDDRLWTSYQWGDTAEFIVLDCRTERLPSTRFTDEATYISREQMDWLKERLLDSTAHFKVVMNSVAITNMPPVWDIGAEDRWEGYPAQREELLDFIIDNDLRNVWFITGDFHLGFVGHVEPEGPAWRLWEIAAGPLGNGPNPLYLTLVGRDQFLVATPDIEAYTTFTFDPIADTVRIRFVNHLNEVLFDEVLSEPDPPE